MFICVFNMLNYIIFKMFQQLQEEYHPLIISCRFLGSSF